jgi:bifunctional non-homologous end joining protein LigD
MAFQPMPLSRRALPFDHPEWIFELKYDGFRSLAVMQNGRTQLISRNGHPFNSTFQITRATLCGKNGDIDGEIVCLDKRGKPQFRDLLFHRGEPCFFAFDLLMSDGKDLRTEKLTDRKHELRRLMPKVPETGMRYADHIENYGTALFQRVCEMDLEGIVAKHSLAPYTTERTTWFKIKNRNYSQMAGREELFERERRQEPVAGWHTCELVRRGNNNQRVNVRQELLMIPVRTQISDELSRLIALQTEF